MATEIEIVQAILLGINVKWNVTVFDPMLPQTGYFQDTAQVIFLAIQNLREID